MPNATRRSLESFRVVARETVYQGFTRLERLSVELVDRAGVLQTHRREVEHHGSGAAVLPFDPLMGAAILVRQLRLPLALNGADPHPLEAIAGLLDKDGEDAESTIRREALEEAGLQLGRIEPAGAPFSSPGISTERIHLYLAECDFPSARTGAGGGLDHEGENIEVVIVALADLAAMADRGQLVDMKTFALIQTLRLRRPELFA